MGDRDHSQRFRLQLTAKNRQGSSLDPMSNNPLCFGRHLIVNNLLDFDLHLMIRLHPTGRNSYRDFRMALTVPQRQVIRPSPWSVHSSQESKMQPSTVVHYPRHCKPHKPSSVTSPVYPAELAANYIPGLSLAAVNCRLDFDKAKQPPASSNPGSGWNRRRRPNAPASPHRRGRSSRKGAGGSRPSQTPKRIDGRRQPPQPSEEPRCPETFPYRRSGCRSTSEAHAEHLEQLQSQHADRKSVV